MRTLVAFLFVLLLASPAAAVPVTVTWEFHGAFLSPPDNPPFGSTEVAVSATFTFEPPILGDDPLTIPVEMTLTAFGHTFAGLSGDFLYRPASDCGCEGVIGFGGRVPGLGVHGGFSALNTNNDYRGDGLAHRTPPDVGGPFGQEAVLFFDDTAGFSQNKPVFFGVITARPEPPSPVATPPTLLLLASGLVMAAWRRR